MLSRTKCPNSWRMAKDRRNDNGEAAHEFLENRRRWREWLSVHSQVNDRAFRVGFWLSARMNGNDQCCWYTVPRIAKELGRSERYVQYALADLRDANALLIVPEKRGPNTYFLQAPFF